MLKRIRLKDFKSFVDEEVEVAPLTLLVGANASGKSNFLDAIRFLQGISFDLYLGEVLNGETRARPDAWPGIRGRAEETVRSGSDAFGMRALWIAAEPVDRTKPEGVQVEGKRAEIFHSVTCVVSPQVYFAEEE